MIRLARTTIRAAAVLSIVWLACWAMHFADRPRDGVNPSYDLSELK